MGYSPKGYKESDTTEWLSSSIGLEAKIWNPGVSRVMLPLKPKGRTLHLLLPAFRLCACVLRSFSRVQLFLILWTLACQAPLFMGFSRQEYWSGFPFPFSGDLPNQRIEPMSLTSPVWAGGFLTTWKGWPSILCNPWLAPASLQSLLLYCGVFSSLCSNFLFLLRTPIILD